MHFSFFLTVPILYTIVTSQDEAEHEVRVPGTAPNAKVGGRFRQLAAQTAAAERGHDTENLQGFKKIIFYVDYKFFFYWHRIFKSI